MVFPTRQTGVLEAHVGAVHCVTYSAGGKYVLTGGADRKINLWNASSRTKIQTYAGHGYAVLDVAVAADNARFASVGGDKAVFVWDVATAQTTRRFEGHWARVNAVAFAAPQHDVLVSASYDATVRFWDCRGPARRPVQTLADARDAVSDVAVRAHEVVAGSVDGRTRVYDVRAGKCTVDAIGAAVTSVRVAADGGALLVGCLDGAVRLMDRATGGLLQAYRGHRNAEFRLRSCFGGNEQWVVSGDEEGGVWAWDLLGGAVRERVRHGGKAVTAVAWKPGVPGRGEAQWVSAGTDGRVVVWGEHT